MVTARSKRLRMEEEIASQPTLVSILPVLVHSGFVGAAELGLLCQTSKEFAHASRSDELWAWLCLQLWSCTEYLPRDFVALHGGHRLLCKEWLCGPQNRLPNRSPMPPPAYAAHQIQLFVNVTYKQKPFLSESLCPEHLDILLKSGAVEGTLIQPIILCEAKWGCFEVFREQYLEGKMPRGMYTFGKDLDVTDFQVRMHVRTGPSMCCVFEQLQSCAYDDFFGGDIHPLIKEGEELSEKCDFDLSKPQSPGRVSFDYFDSFLEGWEGLALKHTPAAAEIKSRLPYRLGFEFYLVLGIVEGGYYAATGYVIQFMKVDHKSDSEVFDTRKEEKAHGVTLLHILSELQGSDFCLEHSKP